MRADFPDDIVDDQAALFGDHVSFEDALDAAVHSYLTDGADGESPLEVVRNIGPWMDCPQADTLDRLLCNLNLGSAVIGIVRHVGDPEEEDMWLPEGGERPDENVWVFYLLIPSTGDHTHWAVVSRERDANGDIAVYNYGFN